MILYELNRNFFLILKRQFIKDFKQFCDAVHLAINSLENKIYRIFVN